jgi:hypothetical protein
MCSGERILVLGFAGIRRAGGDALDELLGAATRALAQTGAVGRLELRALRPAVRRSLLRSLAGGSDLRVLHSGRRVVVVESHPIAGAASSLSSNRRRMLVLAARDGAHCVWCRKPLAASSEDATVDHVRCRSHGGSDAIENLLLACASCNHRRSDRPAELWLQRCVGLGQNVDLRAIVAAIHRAERSHRHLGVPAETLGDAA